MAKKLVLIVEDEAVSRSIIREIIESCGYAAAEAVDGTDGLAQAEKMHPDVILLDIRMPGLDGYEVCRGLKENPETKTIPVIFVTGVQDAGLSQLAFQAGGVACVMKPIRREGLVAVLESVLASVERQSKPGAQGGGSGH
jgi:two-component system, sensor histidine kinase and response regulator